MGLWARSNGNMFAVRIHSSLILQFAISVDQRRGSDPQNLSENQATTKNIGQQTLSYARAGLWFDSTIGGV